MQKTYSLDTKSVKLTQRSLVFYMAPASGSPKPCPLTLISPHQSPYSKNFRQDRIFLSDQYQDILLASNSNNSFYVYLLDHVALEVLSGYFTQYTHTHTLHGQGSSLSASPFRIMIKVIMGNSHYAPLLAHC